MSSNLIRLILTKLFPLPPRPYMTYSAYLENEVKEEAPSTWIPHSELAQHVDEWLNSIWAVLLDPLTPTDLSESALCGLIHYASKFFSMDRKLICQDLQGYHKVVIWKEK